MSDDEPRRTTAHDGESRAGLGRTLAVYSAELTLGVAVGVGCFLLMLWLLSLAFPDSTGLGQLARARNTGSETTRMFVEGPGAVVARLEAVRGDVRDKPDHSVSWTPAAEGADLGDRHAVQSYEDSSATIIFDDANTLELGEKSVVVVRRPRRVAGSFRRRASVMFVDGFLRGRLGGPAGSGVEVEVIAAGGTVRPAGDDAGATEIALAVDSESSSLSVHSGSVEIAWGDEVTVVPEGHMVSYDGQTAPSGPVLMPEPPRLLSPADARRYAYRAAPPDIELSWRAPRADEVELQIARDESFSSIVYQNRQRGSSLTHGNLESGTYWWRVVPYRTSLAGPPSDARRVVITRDTDPPELFVDFPSETVRDTRFRLTGRSEPGSRVVIGPVTLRADAEGRFEYMLPLRDGYNFVVVQSIDAAGNTAFANHAIIAEPPRSGSVQ